MDSNNHDHLSQLLAAQQFEQQPMSETISEYDIDESGSESFHRHRALKRPTVPDMRFEKQFIASVDSLKSEGASTMQIFFSAVIVNQFVMPFINGFTWCVASHIWRWWRLPRQPSRSTRRIESSTTSFARGLKYGISNWLKNAYATLVHIPPLVPQSAPSQSK